MYSKQKGRNRKCSIVQEEEDDIDDQEPSSPLNRRGSRSEGRINVTVQDRLAAEVADRIKKDKEHHLKMHAVKVNNEPDLKTAAINTRSLIHGIAGVKIIKNDDKEKFLGQSGAGVGFVRKEIRSGSVDNKDSRMRQMRTSGDVKILTDSSTIPAINVSSVIVNQMSKPFKTMPSPTRSALLANSNNNNLNSSSINNNCLKEILECDSSDTSNTNTPRPIIRSSQAANSSAGASHHRRTKFHKSRTTSCSSSDASDDDNNAEKKRAGTKIIDCGIVKQIISQRRDSDSSDSQDPGTACSGNNNNNTGSSLILRNGSSSTTTTSHNKSSTQTGTTHESRSGKSSTTNSSEIGYRRHRTGRRRQTETRLRESQSLNRITEVQECEHNNNHNSNNVTNPSNGNSTEKLDRNKDDEKSSQQDDNEPVTNKTSTNDILMISSNSTKILTMNSLNSSSQLTSPPCEQQQQTIQNATNELKANKNQNNTKAKGFSARFLQNLNFKRNHDSTQTNSSSKGSNKSNRNSMPDVPLSKINSGKMGTIRSSQMPSDGSDRSKKIKILGRYFQV